MFGAKQSQWQVNFFTFAPSKLINELTLDHYFVLLKSDNFDV